MAARGDARHDEVPMSASDSAASTGLEITRSI